MGRLPWPSPEFNPLTKALQEQERRIREQYEQQYNQMMRLQMAPPTLLPHAFTAPEATPLPKALIAGPILGWRSWRVREDGALISLHRDTVWPSGRALQGVAKADNDAGIYAMKQRAQVIRQENGTEEVLGQVALWGKVIEHRDGYRAQFGYPYAIDLTPPMPGFPRPRRLHALVEAICERYGCTRLTADAEEAPRP